MKTSPPSSSALPPRPARAAALAALLAASGLACSPASAGPAALPASDPSQPTAVVRLAKPLPRLTGETARATGELRSRLQATVSPRLAGTILRVHIEPGARVRKGDPLVELDPSTLPIQLDQARAARRLALAGRTNARADLSRTQQLFKGEAVPQATLDRAVAASEQGEASVEQADAQVRLLEQNLRDCVIRAPFDGVVTARLRNLGDYLSMMPPTPVVQLVSVDAVEVRLAVPEGLVDALRPGAELRGRTLPGGVAFQARVTSVGVVVDAATRAVEVLAELRGAAKGGREGVRPGGLVEVDLGASGAEEGPFLPAQAVAREGEQRFVWLVAGGAAQRRPVKVVPVTAEWVRVLGGVGPDEAVVVEGGAGLAEGTPVAVAGQGT